MPAETRSTPPRRWLLCLAAMAVAVLAGCASPPPPRDYSAFRQARPASILVLPPANGSPDVLATPSVWSQLTLPLAESGFYVMPVSLVDETLRGNGIQTPQDAQEIPPARLREIFGADAALYVAVTRYGTVYQVISSDAVVALQARLVDLRSGELLWDGSASASSAEQGSSSQGGALGLLIKAIVEQVASTLTDRSHQVAGIASQRLLGAGRPNGLLFGPRHPKGQAQP